MSTPTARLASSDDKPPFSRGKLLMAPIALAGDKQPESATPFQTWPPKGASATAHGSSPEQTRATIQHTPKLARRVLCLLLVCCGAGCIPVLGTLCRAMWCSDSCLGLQRVTMQCKPRLLRVGVGVGVAFIHAQHHALSWHHSSSTSLPAPSWACVDRQPRGVTHVATSDAT
jgi:hypothetical protein